MLDHQMIGASIAARGAGLVLPRETEPADIAAVVRRLLQEPSYHIAAANLGARLRSRAGQHKAADTIEELL
jgi:UDP:flavonoid glycosyltransferase YjiC (YdhE family)